jgi:hypothetical protein
MFFLCLSFRLVFYALQQLNWDEGVWNELTVRGRDGQLYVRSSQVDRSRSLTHTVCHRIVGIFFQALSSSRPPCNDR